MKRPEIRVEPITDLLTAASRGDRDALNQLFPLVYDELRRLARARLRSEREGHTLSTTALVHEAYLKLIGQTRVQWRDRTHFFGVASQAMRRILINHAEARRSDKRGGGAVHVPLDEVGIVLTDDHLDDLLALDDALNRLQAFNQRGADIVVYRFFGGLSYEEIAELTGTSAVTARRAWETARAWLYRELREVPEPT